MNKFTNRLKGILPFGRTNNTESSNPITNITNAIGKVTTKMADSIPTENPQVREALMETETLVREAPQELYDAYLVNLDGTIFSGDNLMPELGKVFKALQFLRRPIRFFSANSNISPDRIAQTLTENGMHVPPEHIIAPAKIAVGYLNHRYPGAKVYAVAEDGFKASLERGGITLSDNPDEIDVVFVAHDRTFTYDKLRIAALALSGERNARLISSSLQRRRLLMDGSSEPGTLAIVRAIEAASKKELTKNLGGPDTAMLEVIFRDLDATPEHTLLVSDALSTDVRMAKNYGVPTALVLTGVSTYDEAKNLSRARQPKFVLDSVGDILPPYILEQID